MGIYTEIRETLKSIEVSSFYAFAYSQCIETWEEHEDEIETILEDFGFDEFCDLATSLWNEDGMPLDKVAELTAQYIIKYHKEPLYITDLTDLAKEG